MTTHTKSLTELQNQRAKLANSYNALLEEFSAKEPRTVGNYTIGKLVGKGSYGKVFLATHKLTNGSKVVLKQADKNDSNLAREIHHHRQFLHPHIARLYEVIVTENSVWLVLEYCPGDELYHYLTKHGPIEPAKVQKIFAQLVGAVTYVHSKSCVHRDLKLENILMDKNENVKLCDFGFTREYEGKASYLQTWCGTVCYSAPEMLRGEKYAGEKVDVWSLGIILYALLCGELPFDEDDETATKMKILKDEPNYPESLPSQAKDLLALLLSKRPLIRPSLADILTNPWLTDRAPQQQAILKLKQPAPFTTQLEKDVLQRMRSAGVDIDQVIENVLSQRCDALAGWWALLLEKEERKDRRRQRRKKEKEAEAKALRRLSGASGHRLDSIGPPIKESDEEGHVAPSPRRSNSRDRDMRKLTGTSITSNLPTLVEADPSKASPPNKGLQNSDKVSIRSRSVSRTRQIAAKDGSIARGNAIYHTITSQNVNTSTTQPPKRRHQQPFMSQLASIKQWFMISTKRGKGTSGNKEAPWIHPLARPHADVGVRRIHTENVSNRLSGASYRGELVNRATFPTTQPRLHSYGSSSSAKQNVPASPLTPQSAYRRRSNLRGRKSTSSSVSSIRSIHKHHTSHSIASSASSTSVASPSVAIAARNAATSPRSTPSSIKILPALAAGTDSKEAIFPSNIRVVRGAPTLSLHESEAAFSGLGPSSPGLLFAKRRRSPFRGPLLGPGAPRRRGDGATLGMVRSASDRSKRRSGIIDIEEEEEDEGAGHALQCNDNDDDDDEFEEVEAFSPVLGPQDSVEEPFVAGGAAELAEVEGREAIEPPATQ